MPEAMLKIEYVSPHDWRPHPRNAKRHSKSQIAKIAKSIRRFGFVSPVLVSDQDEIIAGDARVKAAIKGGLDLIPVVRLARLTPAERLAYNLADNRLADLGRLDRELVAVQLEELTNLGFDDIEISGFSLDDIDIHLEPTAKSNKSRRVSPKREEPASRPSVACRGSELWALGAHRMLIEDIEATAECRRLIDRRQRDMILTVSSTPVYRYQYPDYAPIDRDRSEGKSSALLSAFLHLAKQASSIGASISVFVDLATHTDE